MFLFSALARELAKHLSIKCCIYYYAVNDKIKSLAVSSHPQCQVPLSTQCPLVSSGAQFPWVPNHHECHPGEEAGPGARRSILHAAHSEDVGTDHPRGAYGHVSKGNRRGPGPPLQCAYRRYQKALHPPHHRAHPLRHSSRGSQGGTAPEFFHVSTL